MPIRTLKKPLIGYKKVSGSHDQEVLVKLEIPKGARVRCNYFNGDGVPMAVGDKLRASSARVLSLRTIHGHRKYSGRTVPIRPEHTGERVVQYTVGKVVKPHEFDPSDFTCAGGIHFFTRRDSAIGY